METRRSCTRLHAVGSTLFAYLLLRGRMIPVPLAWVGLVGKRSSHVFPVDKRTLTMHNPWHQYNYYFLKLVYSGGRTCIPAEKCDRRA